MWILVVMIGISSRQLERLQPAKLAREGFRTYAREPVMPDQRPGVPPDHQPRASPCVLRPLGQADAEALPGRGKCQQTEKGRTPQRTHAGISQHSFRADPARLDESQE